jgi:hypothetical protein
LEDALDLMRQGEITHSPTCVILLQLALERSSRSLPLSE